MKTLISAVLTLLLAPTIMVQAAEKQIYEIRKVSPSEGQDAQALDQFLSEQMLPALKRAGAGMVGIFAPAPGAMTEDRFVAVTYASPAQAIEVAEKLRNDEAFIAARKNLEQGGPKAPPYTRVASELLLAMDCMPQAKSPTQVGTPDSRVYELRVYESANEGLGDLKVEMFNAGEVPIFLDCGIQPVFLGQAVISHYAPSLSYLTAYPNEEARVEAWDKFREHPDWKVLSGVEKYKGTVSKIHLFLLRSLPGSEM